MADMTPEERRAAMRAKMEERRKEFEARFPQSAGQRSPPGKVKPTEPEAFGAAASARRKPTEGSSTAQPVSPPPVYSANDNEIATRRLALLTTQDLQSAGYSDLLTAKLTERLAERLELVERGRHRPGPGRIPNLGTVRRGERRGRTDFSRASVASRRIAPVIA